MIKEESELVLDEVESALDFIPPKRGPKAQKLHERGERLMMFEKRRQTIQLRKSNRLEMLYDK